MANSISVLNPANWRPIVQDFLNNMLVATEICSTQFREELVDGDTVNFPYMADVYVQNYAQGTDLTIEPLTATQSYLSIDKSKAVAIPIDPVQERQAKAKFALVMAKQSAFRLANQIDKDVLAEAANAYTTVAGGVLSESTVLSTFSNAYNALFRQNAVDGELFAVIDTETKQLIARSLVANGFVMADATLAHQYTGDYQGFRIYTSNNLPTTATLTMPTIPTAGDYFTIAGVKFTWTAAASATNAGDIAIGINVGAAQANFLLAIAGTATGSAATYIDLSATDRTLLKNISLTAGAFGSDISTLTYVGKAGLVQANLTGHTVFTSGNNFFSVETTSLLFGRMGAISLGMQMMPNLYVREEPKQLARNYITHTLYGVKTFFRDAKRLVKVTRTI